jgi:hypothetical protein
MARLAPLEQLIRPFLQLPHASRGRHSELADVLEKLEKGRIGHRTAMAWLNVKSYDELVEIMHTNGRLMPGHQPMWVSPETRALVRSIFRQPAARAS